MPQNIEPYRYIRSILLSSSCLSQPAALASTVLLVGLRSMKNESLPKGRSHPSEERFSSHERFFFGGAAGRKIQAAMMVVIKNGLEKGESNLTSKTTVLQRRLMQPT